VSEPTAEPVDHLLLAKQTLHWSGESDRDEVAASMRSAATVHALIAIGDELRRLNDACAAEETPHDR
jgi:hypothetical protein